MCKKKTQEQFIKDVQIIGGQYDTYEKTIYINDTTINPQ